MIVLCLMLPRIHAFPALPVCMISLVLCSSLRRAGQLVPSNFASVSSTFVPMILYVDSAIDIWPKSGNSVLYRLLSTVGRSRLTVLGVLKTTFARSLSTFLRYKLAMTLEGV